MLLHLGDRFVINQRPGGDAALQAIAEPQLFHRLLQLFGKAVVNALLHVQAIGANAGLPGVAELGGQRAFNRFIEIGIVEHDKRRVAAELEETFLISCAHCAIS